MGDSKPMASFNLSSEEGEEGEESFVVLGASMVPWCYGDESLSSIKSLENHTPATNGIAMKTPTTLPSTANMSHFSQEAISVISTASDLRPEEIQQKLDFLVEENITLKETLYQNNMAMKKQFDTLVMWQEEVTKVHQSHKEKFAETKKYIEKLKTEKGQLETTIKESAIAREKLEEEVKQLQQSKAEYEKLKEQNQVLLQSSMENMTKFELSAVQKKNCELEHLLEDLRNKSKTTEEDLKQKVTTTDKLTTELAALKKEHDNVQLELTKQNLQNKLMRESLENDLESLRIEKSNCKCTNGKEDDVSVELVNAKEQLMMAQMKITDLETKMQRVQGNEGKDEEVMRLRETVNKLTIETENVGVLKAQVEIYQADFEAERHARSALAEEKDQISCDLAALQRRNQQLLQEVESLRADRVPNYRLETSSSSAAGAASAPPVDSSTRNIYKYECPKCQFRFANYQSLENHVHRCIEIDSIF